VLSSGVAIVVVDCESFGVFLDNIGLIVDVNCS
jgi:hypothetical protein